MELNLDFAKARKLLIHQPNKMHIRLIGCGGTGSWLAPSLARLAKVLIDAKEVDVHLNFQDADTVLEKNIYRQNFCTAEIGKKKAVVLANRYSAAWGIQISSTTEYLKESISISGFTIFVGCVDNTKARRAIYESVSPTGWWLDCGNDRFNGQVMLGRAGVPKSIDDVLAIPGCTTWIPSPWLQWPALLQNDPSFPKGDEPVHMSCAEMLIRGQQGLAINQMVASIASSMLFEMLVTDDLRRMATYVDLPSGSMRSCYNTDEKIRELWKITQK